MYLPDPTQPIVIRFHSSAQRQNGASRLLSVFQDEAPLNEDTILAMLYSLDAPPIYEQMRKPPVVSYACGHCTDFVEYVEGMWVSTDMEHRVFKAQQGHWPARVLTAPSA